MSNITAGSPMVGTPINLVQGLTDEVNYIHYHMPLHSVDLSKMAKEHRTIKTPSCDIAHDFL